VSTEVLERAIREHDPSHVFALFSGGHDSLCATHIASKHPRFSGVIHVNTGIGVEATRTYVRETCARFGWPLKEYHVEGQSYRDLALTYGFPGPPQHNVMYRKLKQRSLERVVREHKTHRHDRLIFVNGARRGESQRRMRTTAGKEVYREKCIVWVSVIHGWAATDRLPYMALHGLPRNPVVDRLHMSGECLCGCFSKPGELQMLEAWYPETAATIRDLEREVRARGLPCLWGEPPPTKVSPDQQSMPFWSELEVVRPRRRMLCQDCVVPT